MKKKRESETWRECESSQRCMYSHYVNEKLIHHDMVFLFCSLKFYVRKWNDLMNGIQ